MTNKAMQQNYETYLTAYRSVEPDARQRLLASVVAGDVVFVLTNVEIHGIHELLAHMEDFSTKRPEFHFALQSFSCHHEQFQAEITLHSVDGTALTSAKTYGKSVDGLLSYLIGFF